MKKNDQQNQPLKAKADEVFEVAFEVCNKVGGIHTVLASKAERMVERYGQGYWTVGPYFSDKIKGEFEEIYPVDQLKEVFEKLTHEHGLKCHFGKWLVKGEPKAILIDFKELWPRADQIKEELWRDFGVDSLLAGDDFTEPVIWAYGVGLLLEKIAEHSGQKKIVAQFHEWLAGAGLLYLANKNSTIGSVFTTHATTLGRTLAFNNIDIYSPSIDPDKEAARYNIIAKHQLERATAQKAKVFTTVSAITADEAERFLGRKADVLLPNGLDAERFMSFEELIIKHQIQRNRLREFLLAYFFPYYSFDLEQTLFYFITGRYEVRAKGIDIFIKALSQLNQKMIAQKSKKTVVAFLWIPANVGSILPELIENKQFVEDIKDSLEEVQGETDNKLLYILTEGKEFSASTLFDEKFLFEVKKKLIRLKKNGLPSLSTHQLKEGNDYIINALNQAGLDNREINKVKVVFYPTYLTGHDGLSNLNYQESIEACHLGAFPSVYEPWGYTPLETAAAGVASVTTDLAGFGRFIEELNQEKKYPGISVLKRFAKSDEEAIAGLADIFLKYASCSKKQRIENKIQARKLAALADWQILVENYLRAHNLAVL